MFFFAEKVADPESFLSAIQFFTTLFEHYHMYIHFFLVTKEAQT